LGSSSVKSEDLKYISKVILEYNQNSMLKMQKEFDKVIIDKDDEISHLGNYNKTLLTKIKKLMNENKLQQEALKKLNIKESLIDIETTTDSVEEKNSSDVKTHTMEETNTNTNEILSTNISSKGSKDEVSKNNMKNARIPYRHPNYKSHHTT
jgi:hypothetical protein